MARIRTIKPEFFTSEDIVSLTPWARLLYIALWCEADKEGRLVWKPKTFKIRYFPADSCSIEKLCTELLDAGLVIKYGDGFAFIPAFKAHQHINPRESASTLPGPIYDASTTRQPRVSDTTPRVSDAQGGMEGKGKIYTRDASSTPDGVSATVWQDFLSLRKAKKAPLTETALAGIRKEAEKAGYSLDQALETCCKRGWQGFDASWVSGQQASSEIGAFL